MLLSTTAEIAASLLQCYDVKLESFSNKLHMQSYPLSIHDSSSSFNKIEYFAHEVQFSINTISMWKDIKEKHEMESAAFTYCIFQLICPINSLDS